MAIIRTEYRIKIERVLTLENPTTTPHLVKEAPLTEKEFQDRPYLQQHYADRPIPIEKFYESKPDVERKTESSEVFNLVVPEINMKKIIEALYTS